MTEISDKGKGLTPQGETSQIKKALEEKGLPPKEEAVQIKKAIAGAKGEDGALPHDTIIQGRNLMLFRQGAESYTALGAATSHTLIITAENADVSNKDTAQFHAVLPGGNIDWKISASCMASWRDLDEGDGNRQGLIRDLIKGEVYKVAFGMIANPSPDGRKPEGGWEVDATAAYVGDAFITSITVNADYASQSTYDVEFQGSGPLLPYADAVVAKRIPEFNKKKAE
ncbi:putative secreted protein [Bacteroidales bacterium Barb6]|nr:putative secreted protein [Bacteroidales bacterium Barb6]